MSDFLKAYIAGKITGDPNYKEKFQKAEEFLRSCYDVVLNPAILPEGLKQIEYMRICFSMIDCCDVVWFLKDWKDSAGARLEHDYAEEKGITIAYF